MRRNIFTKYDVDEDIAFAGAHLNIDYPQREIDESGIYYRYEDYILGAWANNFYNRGEVRIYIYPQTSIWLHNMEDIFAFDKIYRRLNTVSCQWEIRSPLLKGIGCYGEDKTEETILIDPDLMYFVNKMRMNLRLCRFKDFNVNRGFVEYLVDNGTPMNTYAMACKDALKKTLSDGCLYRVKMRENCYELLKTEDFSYGESIV